MLNPQNWHKAIFNKMEFVIYTGPGQAMMHHWVPDTTRPSAAKGGAATARPKAIESGLPALPIIEVNIGRK